MNAPALLAELNLMRFGIVLTVVDFGINYL